MEAYKQANRETLGGFKKVFGNIIEKVYVLSYYNGWMVTKKDIKKELLMEERSLIDKNKDIDNSGSDIIIHFKGGNQVRLTNSEWGSISKTDINNQKEYIKLFCF